jgi:hypothetical protein
MAVARWPIVTPVPDTPLRMMLWPSLVEFLTAKVTPSKSGAMTFLSPVSDPSDDTLMK